MTSGAPAVDMGSDTSVGPLPPWAITRERNPLLDSPFPARAVWPRVLNHRQLQEGGKAHACSRRPDGMS